MKPSYTIARRLCLTALLVLSLPFLAQAQHGGGGHGGGGHAGGHFGGGHGHSGAGRMGRGEKAHGIGRLNVFRVFHRHRYGFYGQPYFFANGLLLGDFVDCGFWDWDCGFGWDRVYFDSENPAMPQPGPAAATPADVNSATITVLYLKNGYSVGVTDYYLENDELHYLTTYGGQDAIPIGELDLQRTVNENASLGVAFVLHPKQALQSSEK